MITSENWVDIEDSNSAEIEDDMRLKINTYDAERNLVIMYVENYYYVVNREDMKAALDNAVNTGAL